MLENRKSRVAVSFLCVCVINTHESGAHKIMCVDFGSANFQYESYLVDEKALHPTLVTVLCQMPVLLNISIQDVCLVTVLLGHLRACLCYLYDSKGCKCQCLIPDSQLTKE